jgi:hypothetical protein
LSVSRFSPEEKNLNQKSSDAYAFNYKNKLLQRCNVGTELGSMECEKAFHETHESCLLKAPPAVNYFICLPLKIDFICGIEKVLPNADSNACDPSNVIDSNFGDAYVELREMEKQFQSHYGNVSFNYTTTMSAEYRAVESINESNRIITMRLEEKTAYMDGFTRLVCGFMVFVYFKVVYGEIF